MGGKLGFGCSRVVIVVIVVIGDADDVALLLGLGNTARSASRRSTKSFGSRIIGLELQSHMVGERLDRF